MAGGRPPKMTDDTVQKLKQAFLMGCTDREACLFAGIVPSTLYGYQEKNPEFTEQKETWKENPVMKSRAVIMGALDKDDTATAHKVIERKEGTKVKQEVTGANGGAQEHKWTIELVDAKDATQ